MLLRLHLLAFFLCFFIPSYVYSIPNDMEFRAEHYERDLRTKIEKGKGKAWLRKKDRELWADELEVDNNTNKVTASGHVHIVEGSLNIFCNKASYLLNGEEATLEDATIIIGQMVITGRTIKQLEKDHYEVTEGMYTNCNTLPITDHTAGTCLFDWKIYGRKFDITIEGYVFVHDAIIYSKDLPLAYIPFYTAPAKTKRQTGVLYAGFPGNEDTGGGITLPFFWVLAPWQDITIYPTHYSKAGFHLGLDYNYNYSNSKKGGLQVFFNQYPFNADRTHPELLSPITPTAQNPNPYTFIQKKKELGILGEWAINLQNTYSLENGLYTRQTLNLVSDPFYPQDYGNDIGLVKTRLAYLRSQATATYPTDNSIFYGGVIHHQSLITSLDSPALNRPELKADRGSVTQLPKLGFSQKATPLLSQILSFEFDSNFNNYWRPGEGFDNNVLQPNQTAPIPGAPYQKGDYIRQGRRFQLLPTLVANVPIASGFQFQPVLRATESLYHFDIPKSAFAHREYVTLEVPFSMYLSKTYTTEIDDFERLTHLIQPRFIYGSMIYPGKVPDHDFFATNVVEGDAIASANQTNPRFDVTDLTPNFEYFRFEFINRLRRFVDGGTVRFVTLQISDQLNTRPERGTPDPNFRSQLGPLQVYFDLAIGPFTSTIEGYYSWTADRVGNGPLRHATAWNGSLGYEIKDGDSVSISSFYRNSVDPTQDEQLVTLSAKKVLPIFVNFGGGASYSLKKGEFRGYELGATFASKPTSCWSLGLISGQTPTKLNYYRFVFQMRFGGSLGFGT